MFPFLREVEKTAESAMELIEAGEWRNARRLLRKLDRSPFPEAWTHHFVLSALIELRQGRPERAKELALQGLNTRWNETRLLEIIRADHPPITSASKVFDITVQAGGPAHGPVAMFDSRRVVTFTVIADDEFEAMRYLCEVARYEPGYSPVVVRVEQAVLSEESNDTKGVYWCSPFSAAVRSRRR